MTIGSIPRAVLLIALVGWPAAGEAHGAGLNSDGCSDVKVAARVKELKDETAKRNSLVVDRRPLDGCEACLARCGRSISSSTYRTWPIRST